MFYLCLTLSTSLNALRPQFQRKGNTKVSLWTLTLKRNKRKVGEQGLSSHLSFPRLQIAKYTTFSLRPTMVLCAEDTPINIGGMNGMLIELWLKASYYSIVRWEGKMS